MNNTVLKIIAALLAIGAVIVAVIGVRMSNQPAPKAVAPVAAPVSVPTEAVVVAAKTIKAGKPILSGDVIIKGVQAPPSQAFRQPQELLGKQALFDIQPGTPLQPSQFMVGTMATLIRPGERAVAVLVDEVIGLGGFAKPGDHVDVLAYLPSNHDTDTRAFAQVTVHDARILAFGDVSQLDADQDKKEPASTVSTDEDAAKKASKARQDLRDFRSALHSALLAIPEADAPRLMLSASTGLLRLALRPPITSAPVIDQSTPSAQKRAEPSPPRYTTSLMDFAPPLVPTRQAVTEDDIIIQEGSTERRLTTKEGNSSP